MGSSIPLREIVLTAYRAAVPEWPGMKIEIEALEFNEAATLPYAHLYPANHEAIFKWSKEDNKFGFNNWINAPGLWDAIQAGTAGPSNFR